MPIRDFILCQVTEFARQINLRHDGGVVRSEEIKVLQMNLLCDIKPVFTVQELNNGAVRGFTDRGIIFCFKTFHALDQAALQVTRPGGLDGSIDKTLTAGHCVEEVLLRFDTSQETSANEATSNWVRVERPE